MPATPHPGRLIDLVVHDAAGLGQDGIAVTEILELRIVPPGSANRFRWEAFPSLVAEASAWVRRHVSRLENRTLLLATVIPPEVAAGLGVDAAQVARINWPQHLWPIV